MAQKIVGVGKVWAGIFCAQNHPSLCQICAGFWCLFSLWWFWSSSLWPFFSHGFRVLKADSISNVFSPGFFGTKVEVFGPWFLCAHFSMDLTSKIIYPLLVGGGVVLRHSTCFYNTCTRTIFIYIYIRYMKNKQYSKCLCMWQTCGGKKRNTKKKHTQKALHHRMHDTNLKGPSCSVPGSNSASKITSTEAYCLQCGVCVCHEMVDPRLWGSKIIHPT